MAESKAPKTKEERNARRAEVLSFMKSIGPYSVPVSSMAEKHDCAVNTIYSDIKYLIKRIKFEDMAIEGRKILMSVTKNMSITDELKATGDAMQRLRAVMASNNTSETLTKIFEQYGFKAKVAEKLNVQGNGNIFNLNEKSVEEIKNDKFNNKPKTGGDAKSSK